MVKQSRTAIVLILAVTFCSAIMAVGSNTVFADEDIDLVIKKLNQSKRILKNKVLRRLGSVPKTGQTTSYDTRDDGDLQRGTPWPNPRFIDNGDGTVTDQISRLIWLKNASCFGASYWTEALDDCNTLTDGQCGLSDGSVAGDWRLPNVNELKSLIHRGVFNPALSDTAGTGHWTEGDPFTNVQSSTYWSATTSAVVTVDAWNAYMLNGYVGYGNKTNYFYVWPVRAGQ